MKNNDNVDIILAQWQTCVEMANAVSQRRDSMNNIFITLNLAIVTAVSITWDIKSIFVLVAGIVTCVLWCFFIRNYSLLNKEKFKVINTMEEKLPVKPYNDEWEKLKKNKKYKDSTKLEIAFPITFGIVYLVEIITVISLKVFS